MTVRNNTGSAENTKKTEKTANIYVNRDLSWLGFNYRVLQEAKDPSVPLMERIKFLAIYSSNLDEFFRIRIAQYRNLESVSGKTKKELAFQPKTVLKELLSIVNNQQDEFSRIFLDQIKELERHNIRLLRRMDLNPEQKKYVETFFKDNLLPYVQPVLLVKNKIKPFLNNAALYLSILMRDEDKSVPGDQYAIVKVPSDHISRFIHLPSEEGHHDLIMLDDIVRHSVKMIFPGYDIFDTYSIKLTRDAELYIEDEFSGDLIQKIRTSLHKRNIGPASRLVYDRLMPKKLLDIFKQVFDLDNYDLLPEGRYHNNFDFFKFPDFNLTQLKFPPQPPLAYEQLENTEDFFKELKERDHLLHFPYHSYKSVLKFFEEAAEDPDVTHIKIVQYRVAKNSQIMNSLIKAVQAGKQVSVFIEVKARFDEEHNLAWGEKLEKAGVRVKYSFPGLKVHSKLALVIRTERNKPKLYAYLGTGNFNEDTAKVYSDHTLFTTDTRLSNEVARVFSFLETVQMPNADFKHLLVGQFNLRSDLIKMIKREIRHAKAGHDAYIILKMNNLQDTLMVDHLVEASKANVKIKLIVRGICCLNPGIPGETENIEVISIVDRYLEHSRVFIFCNNGKEEYYLSSADWMERNLSYRIETAFPVYDRELQKILKDCIDLQLNDNVKARNIHYLYNNTYRNSDNDIKMRSQVETYYYLKRLEYRYSEERKTE